MVGRDWTFWNLFSSAARRAGSEYPKGFSFWTCLLFDNHKRFRNSFCRLRISFFVGWEILLSVETFILVGWEFFSVEKCFLLVKFFIFCWLGNFVSAGKFLFCWLRNVFCRLRMWVENVFVVREIFLLVENRFLSSEKILPCCWEIFLLVEKYFCRSKIFFSVEELFLSVANWFVTSDFFLPLVFPSNASGTGKWRFSVFRAEFL